MISLSPKWLTGHSCTSLMPNKGDHQHCIYVDCYGDCLCAPHYSSFLTATSPGSECPYKPPLDFQQSKRLQKIITQIQDHSSALVNALSQSANALTECFTQHTHLSKVAEVQSRTLVWTLNPWTKLKVQVLLRFCWVQFSLLWVGLVHGSGLGK